MTVRMPQMGVSVEEGVVTAWHVAVGDAVAEGQAVCEVSTDKVDTEVVAEIAGVVGELLAAEGDTVAVGAPLLRFAGETDDAAPGDDADAAPGDDAASGATPRRLTTPTVCRAGPTPGPAASVSAPATPAPAAFDPVAAADEALDRTGPPGRIVASPVARRLAEELGVDLGTVSGSGRRGRIAKRDVLAARDQPGAPQPAAATSQGRPPPVAAGDLPRGYDDVAHEIVATSHLRRVTAEHMIRSRQTAAHMTTEVDVDLHRLTAVRARLNAERAEAGLPKLSFLPFIARAMCAALREFPDLNATFEVERMIRWRQVNLGIAVDTPQGLMVPVARGCEQLTVEGLGERFADLAERARARKLTADDMRAGTFTISNPGSVGAASAMAIINQPQVAILGLPVIARRPWVVDLPDGGEAVVVRPVMRPAITFDHRAIDGAYATRAAVHLKASLESWDLEQYR